MEAEFIGGKFFEDNLEKNQRYLYRYFSTPIQKQFVRYYLMFRRVDTFVDHTGFQCTKRWLENLGARIEKLEVIRKQAQSEANIELLAQIDAGDYKLD